jgi:NAD-dependent dihydropyrimidine dehydrogenase PreA subunit
MSQVTDVVRDLLQALFRLFPWPTEAGLRRVGSPGPESPVLVTGNYDLTVRRLLLALRGLDAWVVVAASGGINVWCAAAGGHLTTHQVVTALKTSGIDSLVRHRLAILPQLAATGVLGHEVAQRCGWKVRFGPVYAEDLPPYLAAHAQKADDMRRVRFGLRERFEMGAAWAAPVAIVLGGLTALFRGSWVLPVVVLAVVLAFVVFLLYDRIPGPRRAIVAAAGAVVAVAVTALAGGGTGALVTAALGPVAITALLTFDFSGSTPIEGGSHFEERRWHITLDPDLCTGIFRCWEVCPEGVYEKSEKPRKALLAHDERCIRCGACIVQCPEDALFFLDDKGARIEPETIRRFKLTLMGQRTIDAGQVSVETSDVARS